MIDLDLKLFFDPVSAEIELSSYANSAIVQSLYLNQGRMPDIEGMDIALVGILESRGAHEINQEGISKAADEIRKAFYNLKKGSGNLKIVDLGNFRNGPDLQDTYQRLQEVCCFLMERKVIPLLIGGCHSMDLGLYKAYENLDKIITLLSIDNKLDMADPTSSIDTDSHNNLIFKHDPNFLFNFYQVGYQSYLVDPREAELLERLYFEGIRLGVVKENVKELEPIVRDADMMSFDVSAIQSHYCPGGVDSKVYGLTGEESCQLCWYAGLNDKLSSVGFFDYDVNKDSEDRKTAFVIATMIWYFVEGYYNRKGEKSFVSNDYLIYEVPLGGDPSSIRFYKSKITEKWWMEVPHPKDTGAFMRNKMIPCSYSDYEQALEGEVPNRWITTYSKMI